MERFAKPVLRNPFKPKHQASGSRSSADERSEIESRAMVQLWEENTNSEQVRPRRLAIFCQRNILLMKCE